MTGPDDDLELPDPLELFQRMQREQQGPTGSELPESDELFEQMVGGGLARDEDEQLEREELLRLFTGESRDELPDPMLLYQQMVQEGSDSTPDFEENKWVEEEKETLPDPQALFEQMRRELELEPIDDLRLPLPGEETPVLERPKLPETKPNFGKEPLGFFSRLKNRFKKTTEPVGPPPLPPLPTLDSFAEEVTSELDFSLGDEEELPTPEELFRQLAEEQGPELPKLPDLEEFKRVLEEEEKAKLDPDLEHELSGPERFVPTVSDSMFSGVSSLPSFFDDYDDVPIVVPKDLPKVERRVEPETAVSSSNTYASYEPPPPNLEARLADTDEDFNFPGLEDSFFEETTSPPKSTRVKPRYDGNDPSKVSKPQSRFSLPEDRLSIEASRAQAPPPQHQESATVEDKKKKVSPGKGRRFGRYQLAVFTRQMSVMLKSGIQLHSSIAFAAESDPVMRPMLDDVVQKVESGYSFSNAIATSSRSFDPVYVGLVQAGEQSGRLPEMLERLADVLEREIAIRKKLVATVTYPAMLLLVCFLGTLGFIFFVLPTLIPLFRDLGVSLPMTTRILLASRDFIIPLLIAVGVVSAGLWLAWDRIVDYVHERPILERRLAAIPFRLPVIGDVYDKVVTARVLYSLSTMLDVGITLNQALARSESTAGNALVSYRLSKARFDLADGVGVTDCFRLNELFSPAALHLISAGEEAAKLADMFQYVAKLFDEEVEYALDAATNLLEPMIMVVMGLVVGFITISAAAPTIQLLHNFT